MAQFFFNGNSETRIGESKDGYYYNETLVNTYLQYGNFNQWLQLEFSDPPELGRAINGLRKLRLEYNRGAIALKLGDLYEIWNRGIVLNSLDDQAIDRDTGIRGMSVDYSGKGFDVHFITGLADISQSTVATIGFNDRTHNYTTKHNLYGLKVDYDLGEYHLGASFLQSKEAHPIVSPRIDTLDVKNQLLSGHYGYSAAFYDMYLEYTMNRSYDFNENDELFNEHLDGRAFYGNLNLYLDLFSVNVEYINYRFGNLDPSNRWNPVDNYGLFQPYQNPPIAMNLHENVLMNRIAHQIDFNNEVGYKVEVLGMLTDWIDYQVLYSASSRTNTWLYDVETHTWAPPEMEEPALLPQTDIAAMPFRDIFGELTMSLMDRKLLLKLGLANSYDVMDLTRITKTDTSSYKIYEMTDGTTLPIQGDLTLQDGWSLGLKVETQRLTKGTKEVKTLNDTTVIDRFYSDYYNANESLDYATNRFISISVGKSPTWSLALTLDQTDALTPGPVVRESYLNFLEELLGIDQSLNWANIEFLFNINPSIRISMLYGSLKGGLICINGVCRTIEPFDDGFKLGLTMVF